MDPIIQRIAQELDQKPEYVENVVRLLDEGNTIPFIARYRKELHGAMDDTSCGRWKSAWPICGDCRSGGKP